jgi:hypothetical protein
LRALNQSSIKIEDKPPSPAKADYPKVRLRCRINEGAALIPDGQSAQLREAAAQRQPDPQIGEGAAFDGLFKLADATDCLFQHDPAPGLSRKTLLESQE